MSKIVSVKTIENDIISPHLRSPKTNAHFFIELPRPEFSTRLASPMHFVWSHYCSNTPDHRVIYARSIRIATAETRVAAY